MSPLKLIKDLVLVLVCLALVVPAVLFVSGKLPYKIYVVHTGSMTPTIPSDSAVIVKEGVYHVGQVISFRTQHGVVTHRVVKRNADGTLVTKGDANQTADYGSIQPSQVIGGVVAAPQMVGYWLWYLKKPTGLASVIMTIVCLWLIYSIAMAYAKRRQRTGAAAPASATVKGVAGATVEQGGRAGEALQKVPVGWHFVEWPFEAEMDAGAAMPEPILVTPSASEPARHELAAVWHAVGQRAAGMDGAAAIPESIAVTQPAPGPARHKPPVVWHFVEWPLELDADALAALSSRPKMEPARNEAMGRTPPRGALAKLVGVHRPIW